MLVQHRIGLERVKNVLDGLRPPGLYWQGAVGVGFVLRSLSRLRMQGWGRALEILWNLQISQNVRRFIPLIGAFGPFWSALIKAPLCLACRQKRKTPKTKSFRGLSFLWSHVASALSTIQTPGKTRKTNLFFTDCRKKIFNRRACLGPVDAIGLTQFVQGRAHTCLDDEADPLFCTCCRLFYSHRTRGNVPVFPAARFTTLGRDLPKSVRRRCLAPTVDHSISSL